MAIRIEYACGRAFEIMEAENETNTNNDNDDTQDQNIKWVIMSSKQKRDTQINFLVPEEIKKLINTYLIEHNIKQVDFFNAMIIDYIARQTEYPTINMFAKLNKRISILERDKEKLLAQHESLKGKISRIVGINNEQQAM